MCSSCQVVVDGHVAIGALIQTPEGRAQVAQTFNFCDQASGLHCGVLPSEEIALHSG